MQANNFRNKTYFDYSKNKNISCSDCGESNPDQLALCEECGFYFCNKSFRKESHIVIHLLEEECTHITTNYIPKDKFKCEKCDNENIFDLKFLIKENELFFLCKNCSEKECDFQNVVEDGKFNIEIIKDSNVPKNPDNIAEEAPIENNPIIDNMNELEIHDFDIPQFNEYYLYKKIYVNQLIGLTR